MDEELVAAREAYERHDWGLARERYLAARAAGAAGAAHAAGAAGTLPPEDVHSLAEAHWWLGMVTDALRGYEEAYRLFLSADLPARAAMSALDVAFTNALRGDLSLASGWMNRFQRLLGELPWGVEHGYALHMEIEAILGQSEFEPLMAKVRQMQEMGRRYADPDLSALGFLDEGRVLIRNGRVAEGLAVLDEAMLAASSGEMNPALAGNIYCNVIAACHELADLRRMADWTEALARWCESLPPAVLFTGICRVHRVQLMQVRGSWDEAENEAVRICEEMREVHSDSVAQSQYAIGEIRRLRGDHAGAEAAFLAAHRLGRDPQPGLALLRLAQGRAAAARASIQSALTPHAPGSLGRVPFLAAQVEIALSCEDLDSARAASQELEGIAAAYASPGLRAFALSSAGALLLAEERCRDALPVLQDACRAWQDLDAPYDTAQVRVRLAHACMALADPERRALELAAAAETFERLGAVDDSRRVAKLRGAERFPNGLTAREVDVLTLVAAGRTNRQVASELLISQKTVARHLSNIFAKCQLSSRTAAAAFAFERGLASPRNG